MRAFLLANGVDAIPKYLPDGSLKGCWRLYNKNMKWTIALAEKLESLGFVNFDGDRFGPYAGNGGMFMVFARGHYELLEPSTYRPVKRIAV